MPSGLASSGGQVRFNKETLMIKKIILATMLIFSCMQPAVAMQASLSSMLSSIKSVKNPALVAGGALAAVTTLAGIIKYCWINRDFAQYEKPLCNQQKLNKAVLDSAQNAQARSLAQEAYNSIETAQKTVGEQKSLYRAKLWRPMMLGYLSSLSLILYGLYKNRTV